MLHIDLQQYEPCTRWIKLSQVGCNFVHLDLGIDPLNKQAQKGILIQRLYVSPVLIPGSFINRR